MSEKPKPDPCVGCKKWHCFVDDDFCVSCQTTCKTYIEWRDQRGKRNETKTKTKTEGGKEQ